MYMKLRAVANSSFPTLAWIAEVNRHDGTVALHHGPLVEVRQNFFIEGVWDGPFQHGNFGETDCVFGTGGILSEESIRFVTSAATTDFLYYAEQGALVTVSNSLPLLLAYVRDSLDPHYPDYPSICDSVMDGIDDYRRDIPTKRGKVRRQMFRNLDVSREKILEAEKRMPPGFECFEEYRNYLRSRYALIAANARDGARTQPLEICSTQSRGYDTTTVNSIASAYGIDKVFTVSQAKSNFYLAHNDAGKLPSDDGGEICTALGLKCIRLNRRAFTEEFEQEYLFYSALHHNQDANLKDMAKHISKPSLLLTGTYGSIWDTEKCFSNRVVLDAKLRRSDLSSHGMSEFRLVVGFIQVAFPYLGARRMRDILRITESSEMDPWRLGNLYDRPISRRIAEEAGVPRQLFGQSKHGSVVIFSMPSIPYSKALRDEFFAYLVDENIMTRPTTWLWPVVRWVNSILMLKREDRFAVVHYTERVISKLTRREFHFKRLWTKIDGALFCFCVNRRVATYVRHNKAA
jgi:hypothetical protein